MKKTTKKGIKMKKSLFFTIVWVFFVSSTFAANFSPSIMKLSAAKTIKYNFDGSKLEIPVTVTGAPANLTFTVFTKDQGPSIGKVLNGFLGWHYVNSIDTCIYVSSASLLDIGSQKVIWDGKGDAGKTVPAGTYTYYMWAFDFMNSKKLAFPSVSNNLMLNLAFSEYDENGKALAAPVMIHKERFGTTLSKWILGNDPTAVTLMETCFVTLPQDWGSGCGAYLSPVDNWKNVYLQAGNSVLLTGNVAKYGWVPNGNAVLDVSWGENGYVSLPNIIYHGNHDEPGVVSDGEYLYTADGNHFIDVVATTFYKVAFDGTSVESIDLSDWWSDPSDAENGGQMNGGPNTLFVRNKYVFLNCHTSCVKQLVDPKEKGDDFFVWTNGNGDYILDHNFEPDAKSPWVCNDYNVAPFTYGLTADANLFSVAPVYDLGAVSFALLAPDGTGVANMSFAGETANPKDGSIFVDNGSSFDGIYTDNRSAEGAVWGSGMYFIAHDSIKGVITNQVSVEETAPVAFTVEQNTPNPFNPSTTINFSIPSAAHVTIYVYNVAGQKVDTIAREFMSAGSHSVTWNASGLSAGVYFYTVKAGGFAKTIKMTLLK